MSGLSIDSEGESIACNFSTLQAKSITGRDIGILLVNLQVLLGKSRKALSGKGLRVRHATK